MKSNFKIFLAFLLAGLVIGFAIALQLKSGVPKQSSYPLDQLRIQRELIAEFIGEQQKLENEVTALNNELAGVKKDLGGYEEKSREIKLKSKIGLTEVKGSGIEIFLADSDILSAPEDSMIRASDLRDIVNLLFSSDAQALSINNQRIFPLTSINAVSNAILIDKFYIFPPFTIEAAGNMDILIDRLNDENFLTDLHKREKNKKIRFSVRKRDSVLIPPYRGTFSTKFLNPK